jgi:NADP-dependent 3-hydroxy acid dehydrogenase YdfG
MRVWMVTGCSTGLGNALARRILASGDALVATVRHSDTLQDLVTQAPDRAVAARLDVTDTRSVQAAVGEAVDRFGRLDAVVNNAGYGVVATRGPALPIGIDDGQSFL